MILLPHCRVNVKFHLFTTGEGGREIGECEMIERVSTDEDLNSQIPVTW